MQNEKKELGGWWIWILALIVLSTIVLSGLKYAGIIGTTIVEREVFKNSFQYSEARKTEQATFEAQLSEINRRLLSQIISQDERNNLEAQAASIRILLTVSRSK